MTKHITCLLVSVLLLSACSGHKSFKRQLCVADSLMDIDCDSAYRMLRDMDSLAVRMPKPLRMKHLLLRCNAQNKAYDLFTTDSTANELVRYYDRKGTPNERMLAHYLKGCAYRDMDEEPEALRYFNEAVAQADTSSADCDFAQLAIIYGQIAYIFDLRSIPDESLRTYEMGEWCAWKAKNTLLVLNLRSNKSDVLIDKGLYDEAIELNEKTATYYRSMGHIREAARTLYTNIKLLIQKRLFKRAKAAMDEYEALSGNVLPDGKVKPGYEAIYNTKGVYYLGQGKMDSALYFFNKLQEESSVTNNRYLAAWGQTQVYQKLGNSDSLAKYALETLLLHDSIYVSETARNHQNIQALYDYTNHEQVARQKTKEAKEAKTSRQKWIFSSFGIAVFCILVYMILHRRLKDKQIELQTASKKNGQLHVQIETKDHELGHLKGQISKAKCQINELNKNIEQKKVELQQAQNLLLEKEKEMKQQEARYDRADILNLTQNEPAVKHIMEMGEARNGHPSYGDWHGLYPVVERYYPRLTEYRDKVNEVEYQICILIKLECRLGDIAYLTNISGNNLSVIRMRLLQKLFGITEGGTGRFDSLIKDI